jgi:ketosteroid isomerase-like protein
MSVSGFRIVNGIVIVICVGVSAFAQKAESKKDQEIRDEIAGLGRAYSTMIQQNDVTAIEKILADDYLLADEEGQVFTKQEDLATYPKKKERVKITTIEYLDQNVRLIARDVAVDHSTIRFLGTSNGKPFDITERCTTTWAKRNGKWLIVADHFSVRPLKK